MRFKLRRHLVVTALAAMSLLPFAGCSSSSQQQAGDDGVEATDQGGDDKSAANSSQGENSGGSDQAATNNASDGATANTADAAGGGNEVVTNNAAPAEAAAGNAAADTGSADGDLKEMITEMGSNGAPAAAAADDSAAPAAPTAANAAPATAEAPAAAAPAPAAAGPAVPGLPEMGSKMAYVIESGDTLGKVATKIYGDQKRWHDIASLSGISDPNHIYPGDVVYFSLDEKSSQFASTYEAIKRSKEVVHEGDTLASISKRVYGSSKSWKHIWRQNDKIDNPDKLEPGMTVFYVEKGAIQTALNKLIKKVDLTILKATANHSAIKAGKLMTSFKSNAKRTHKPAV